MSDVSITKANVKPSVASGVTTSRPLPSVLGEAVTAGQPVYLKSSDGKYYLALSAGTVAQAAAVGIAAADGSAGQSVPIYSNGTRFAGGASFTVGIPYFVSNNPGGIAPFADLGSGDFVTMLGYSPDGTDFLLAIQAIPYAYA